MFVNHRVSGTCWRKGHSVSKKKDECELLSTQGDEKKVVQEGDKIYCNLEKTII